MNDNVCILLFVKYPDKGKVKSRLSKELDENTVLRLYECFVLDLIETMNKGRYRFKICFSPLSAQERISSWLGKSYSYTPQDGRDLGEKMKNAFQGAFSEGCEKAILIGSDIPDVTNEIIDEAFACDADAVIGPAMDGGYYLIGFRHTMFLPYIFEGMQWSTESVFEKTMECFAANNYNVHILPKWRDIDTPKDLKALYESNKNTGFADSRTMVFIAKNLKKFFKILQDFPAHEIIQ